MSIFLPFLACVRFGWGATRSQSQQRFSRQQRSGRQGREETERRGPAGENKNFGRQREYTRTPILILSPFFE